MLSGSSAIAAIWWDKHAAPSMREESAVDARSLTSKATQETVFVPSEAQAWLAEDEGPE